MRTIRHLMKKKRAKVKRTSRGVASLAGDYLDECKKGARVMLFGPNVLAGGRDITTGAKRVFASALVQRERRPAPKKRRKALN